MYTKSQIIHFENTDEAQLYTLSVQAKGFRRERTSLK